MHYATHLKVAGSIPYEVIGFFNLPNPSSPTMAMGSAQSLTEVPGIFFGVKEKRCTRLAALPIFITKFSRKCGRLGFSRAYGPPRPVTDLILPFIYTDMQLNRLYGLVVRVPGFTTEMYCVSCEVRTEFMYVM
jgi:hypothetical protein